MHSDFIVFADESGDHSLAKINPVYPVFVLSFCIFRRTDYFGTVCPLLQQFKLRWWMHDGVVLHSLRIRRKELPFVFLKKLDTREQFMTDLTETLARCPFTLVAAAIDKVRLRERDLQPENPQMRNRAFDSIQEKFDRGPNGELMGWGLEIYPRKTKGPDD